MAELTIVQYNPNTRSRTSRRRETTPPSSPTNSNQGSHTENAVDIDTAENAALELVDDTDTSDLQDTQYTQEVDEEEEFVGISGSSLGFITYIAMWRQAGDLLMRPYQPL